MKMGKLQTPDTHSQLPDRMSPNLDDHKELLQIEMTTTGQNRSPVNQADDIQVVQYWSNRISATIFFTLSKPGHLCPTRYNR